MCGAQSADFNDDCPTIQSIFSHANPPIFMSCYTHFSQFNEIFPGDQNQRISEKCVSLFFANWQITFQNKFVSTAQVTKKKNQKIKNKINNQFLIAKKNYLILSKH